MPNNSLALSAGIRSNLLLLQKPYELRELDIEQDPALRARVGLSIPVLAIGGRVAFKGRMDARDFEKKFARRVRELGARERSRDG